MSPVSAPADKRFRRAHVKPARRRRWFARAWPTVKRALLVGIVAFAVYQAGQAVGEARVLSIRDVLVDGNSRLPTSDVLDKLHGLRGEHILRTDLQQWRVRLREVPWIKDASLRRRLPSTVEVIVQERTPLAIGRLGDGLYVVDTQGVVIDEYGQAYVDLDLPIVDGLSNTRTKPGERTDEARASLAAKVIRALAAKPDVAARVSQIDVKDIRNAAVILSGDSTLVQVGEERFLERVELYLELGSVLRESVPDIDYVNLRFDERDLGGKVLDHRIYVRPAQGAASSRPPPSSAASSSGAPRPKRQ
jgi:cell division protein FtsQ